MQFRVFEMKSYACILLIISIIGMSGCSEEDPTPQVDCSTDGPSITLVKSTQTNCGEATGSIEVSASGGTGTYEFMLSSQSNADGVFTGLDAGSYSVEVSDENGCTVSIQVSVETPDGVEISSIDVQSSGCNTTDGELVVNVTSGTSPYTYSLDGGTFQESNTFSGLGSGVYSIQVMDAAACVFTESAEVLTGVSFSSQVSSIISTNCAVSGCHDGSTSLPNFSVFATIQANASKIKTRTQNGSMPKTGSLTQEEIDLIACWVDDGALDN